MERILRIVRKSWGMLRWYGSKAGLRQVVLALSHIGWDVQCPFCGWRGRNFYTLYEVDPRCKDNGERMCPRCYSKDRHRCLYFYLKSATGLFTRPTRLLEIGPERYSNLLYGRLGHIHYVGFDYSSRQANMIGDVQQLPFSAQSFDLAISFHIFEHIPNDLLAMSELRRVLKSGAVLLAQVPIHGDTTLEDPSITDPAKRKAMFGQEDHVRAYGRDFTGRLTRAGFAVHEKTAADYIPVDTMRRYGIRVDEVIYVCCV